MCNNYFAVKCLLILRLLNSLSVKTPSAKSDEFQQKTKFFADEVFYRQIFISYLIAKNIFIDKPFS